MMAGMIDFLTGLHNLLRWVVLVAGVLAIGATLRGLASRAPWTDNVRRLGLVFLSSLHLQLVLGLILYAFSPLVRNALGNMSAAMQSDQLRFFVVEHLTLMILAVVAAQLGYSLSKRVEGDQKKYVRASVGYGLAGILLIVGIPWWRPLIPWL
jgi:cytochrome c oxidase assembly factor CtaG